MTTTITVTIPIKTGRGQNEREHWGTRARRVKAERTAAALMLARHRKALRALGSAQVTVLLERRAPSEGLDDDNLIGSLKAVRDEVAAALDRDDADPSITWDYAQETTKRGDWAVRVAIGVDR